MAKRNFYKKLDRAYNSENWVEYDRLLKERKNKDEKRNRKHLRKCKDTDCFHEAHYDHPRDFLNDIVPLD